MAQEFDALDIAYTMRKANRSLRGLFSDYEKKATEVKDCIRRVMDEQQKDVLPATIDLMTAAAEMGNQVHALWFLSAAYDLLTEQQQSIVPADRARQILAKLNLV